MIASLLHVLRTAEPGSAVFVRSTPEGVALARYVELLEQEVRNWMNDRYDDSARVDTVLQEIRAQAEVGR